MDVLWIFLSLIAWGDPGEDLGQISACDGGSGEACRLLAEALLAEGASERRARAIDLFGRACEYADAESCLYLAQGYHRGDGLPLDFARSATFHSKACELGESDACREVADLHTSGSLGSPDPVAAQVWYRLGCDLGDPPSCTAAAMGMERGDSGAVDPQATMSLLTRACEGGHAEGCVRLAARVRDVQRDRRAAVQWFHRGCELGSEVACRESGLALLRGRLRDTEAAARALSTACAGNDPVACEALARLHRKTDRDVAHHAAQRGCAMGHDPSCRLVKRTAPPSD
ncbi:MAG: sel1 repeat family protein [Myxococcales bacterium]|nr:sel1 repeat family protein [Myxococcales bacterium]